MDKLVEKNIGAIKEEEEEEDTLVERNIGAIKEEEGDTLVESNIGAIKEEEVNLNATDSESEICLATLSDTLIATDVKFNNGPLEEKKKPRRRFNIADIELKKKQEEEYNNEVCEQRYKRLMHLLNKSKFYSSYLINKIEDNISKKQKIKKRKRPPVIDENTPPVKKTKQNNQDNAKYDIKEYISTEVKRKVQGRRARARKILSDEEIEEELSADSDTEANSTATTSSVAVTPKYFHGELRDYQHEGLEWLKLLYKNGLSGILADEMGLGKTIQVIALICHLIETRQTGPFLIIAPLSTIPNWMIEFERFAPEIPVVLFYGTPQERADAGVKINRTFPVEGYRTQSVAITTYEVPFYEQKFLRDHKWRYIIIDEGHRIKNYNCKLIKYVAVKN